MPTPTPHTPATPAPPANIWERLERLARSAAQDLMVRRLLNAGLTMECLDAASLSSDDPTFNPVTAVILGHVLIFRDRTGQRWVIDQTGKMMVAGRSRWEILP